MVSITYKYFSLWNKERILHLSATLTTNMNKPNTRNLIASIILALFAALGLSALYAGSGEVAASFVVVISLAVLGAIELRGASRRRLQR